MIDQTNFESKEKAFLIGISAFGFVVLNTVFVYSLFFSYSTIAEAIRNPVALVFIIESFLLLGVLTFLLKKWDKLKFHWMWFVFLSLLGGLAFSIPIAILWKKKS